MNTEDILWNAIKDIENGNAKTIKEDPCEGFLDEKSRKGLTKINVCAQSAKYTKNNKPITRPTLDSYLNIVNYIENKSNKNNYKEEVKELKIKLENSNKTNNYLKEALENTAQENYELRERIRILENKLKSYISIVD